MPGRPARSVSHASPPPPDRNTPDRTTLVVRLGLLLLLLLGVGSVFGESLMGLVYPPAAPSGATEPTPTPGK